MIKVTHSFKYGPFDCILETGEVARQASAAVMVKVADTAVLVTVVGNKNANPGQDFLPLTVNYQERTYAAGKIPGGFFRREGRPGENEILTCRLIDRPMRPLFPKKFRNEVQVVATVMSSDPQVNPDIPALIGAAAAMSISGIPFNGPLAAARVGHINGRNVLNPTRDQITESELDLVVAGTADAVLMVESKARELPEADMLNAVVFGHEQMQTAIRAIEEFAREVGVTPWDWQEPEENADLMARVKQLAEAGIASIYDIADKGERREKLDDLREKVMTEFPVGEDPLLKNEIKDLFGSIEKRLVRGRILAGKPRIDGRDKDRVRPLQMRVGLLPRAHGSSLFTRGETQALVVSTLGTERDAQIIDSIEADNRAYFMLHYNFPPYCVGETGFMGSPKRREIGHGNLAKSALRAVMPLLDDFPYSIRLVSEVTESNGSSSMATVCGCSLALMDAGVPISRAVAGVAMGLILEDSDHAVLTDILGDEDHLGDMDFKVAGTSKGVTALQMDIKITGVNREIMEAALKQAAAGRLHILSQMDQVIDSPREELSRYAPRYITMSIPQDRIAAVIGKGGAVIRSITEETGAIINIADDGTIKIASTDMEAGEMARERIKEITMDVEVGSLYKGEVQRVMDFGALVSFLPGRNGLVHISQISNQRVNSVADELKEGQHVRVKVIDIDSQGRVRLTMRGVDQGRDAAEA